MRQGFVRWAVATTGGCRGEVGVQGSPSSGTVHARVAAPLPASVSLDAYGQTRWARSALGQERVDSGSLGLRRQVLPGLSVQPGIYLVDVRSRNDMHWMGASLRVEYRGAELIAHHEGDRGSAISSRKRWSRGGSCVTLGAQLIRHPIRPDRGLVELGVLYRGLGFSLYPGDEQRAVLFFAGPLQIGAGSRRGLHQAVLGFRDLSLSLQRLQNGATEVGFGFVFRGQVRAATRTARGWSWKETLPKSALADPRIRWPGLASLL
jgi:hypothetical protein